MFELMTMKEHHMHQSTTIDRSHRSDNSRCH